jgi:putative long chain acyl-CoA synthase
MELVPGFVARPVGRIGAAAQNAFEVARFGGLDVTQERSPFTVVAEDRVHRLRHYGAGSARDGDGDADGRRATDAAPLLLVPPMMLAADIYDVSPASSAVTLLQRGGVDPWVVDFGAPEQQPGGLERTLADHVRAISAAIDRVREATGRAVHLGGYSQGGMFAYQVAAYRRGASIASLVTFGSTVDARQGMPFGLPENLAAGAAAILGDRLFRARPLPAWASRAGFQLLDPVKSARSRLEFLRQLHDREALLAREGQRRFLEADGWVAWPGPAMADFLRQFIAHNRLLEGGFVVDDRLLTLAELTTPILSVIGTVDEIAPAAGVRAIREAAPSAPVYELRLAAGHFGLVVGEHANQHSWPAVADWVRWREAGAPAPGPPPPIAEMGTRAGEERAAGDVRDRVGYNLALAGGVGGGIVRSAAAAAQRTAHGALELSREAAGQLPRLSRLQGIGADTRISLGRLVEERRRADPAELLFLFGERAHSAGEVGRRIDDAVRGLIAVGVRQGEHVGVLMDTHPGSLALVTALSRIGAVAVMLRPGADPGSEARLGQARRIVADPRFAAGAERLGVPVHVFELRESRAPGDPGIAITAGGRELDVATVRLPRWYRPNPGRASELAFILFTGEGDTLRMSRITNGRWVTSALGTASSAALSASDTVLTVTPIHHPSALMMSIGGAVAGGARVALATGERAREPAVFWEEIRRYGVTVAAYTWTSLRALVDAPPQPGERHHPVRLFIGSGMPRGLWRRVQERFAPARVLEFYASTETGAILVNLSAAKLGAMGRALPGSPEVRLAAYDPASDQLVLGHGGFVRQCRGDEVGLLLARARRSDAMATVPLRGVFRPDDAWLSTGDLFRRDADGDLWRLDSARDLVLTARGPVYAGAVRDALGDLPEADLVVTYALPAATGRLAVTAIQLRGGRRLTAAALSAALGGLAAGARPDVVHVVDEIPVTRWYRPMAAPLRERGLPPAGPTSFAVDRGGERYRPLSAAARRRLSGDAR